MTNSIESESIDFFRRAVIEHVPPGMTVAVVSRGDDRLLEIEGRTGWHFPRSADGCFAGHYPADDAEAIALIESERSRGAGYIVFPATSLWWLDHYKGLASYLGERCRQLRRDEAFAAFAFERFPAQQEQLHRLLSQPRITESSPHELFSAVDDEFWFWLNTEGCRRSEVLRQLLPSLPDEQTQAQVIGNSGDHALREGFNAYRLFKTIYRSHRGPVSSDCRVLDFGCGWGRIIRFFLKDLPGTQLVGADCSQHMVEICHTTNHWCDFVKTPATPPCSLPSESFDLIYLYSVFSHLSEDQQRAWRKEFHRVLKPGGLLVATTWHRGFIEKCHALRTDPALPCESKWRKELETVFVETQRHLDDYDSGRFVYSPYERERAPWTYSGGVSLYGEACVPRRYVVEQWADLFEFVDFIEDRAVCPQNVIAVRKRGSSR